MTHRFPTKEDKSECDRVLEAVNKGWTEVKDIADHSRVSLANARTYLTRLKDRGLIDKVPAKYVPKEKP